MVNWVEIGPHVFDKLTESTTGRSACGGLACVGVAGRASPPPALQEKVGDRSANIAIDKFLR